MRMHDIVKMASLSENNSHKCPFLEKNYWTKYFFLYSVQICSGAFLILNRTERDLFKMYTNRLLNYKSFCQTLLNLEFSQQNLDQIS